MSSESQPDRIQPYYSNATVTQDIVIEDTSGRISQGSTVLEGNVKVVQQWAPMGVLWYFNASNVSPLQFGEVELKTASMQFKGRLFSKGQNLVVGFTEEAIEKGSDHNLDRVIFHLRGYPDFVSDDCHVENLSFDGKNVRTSWTEIVLTGDGWTIRLQPISIEAETMTHIRLDADLLTGVGEIRKSDGSQFKKKHVRPILEVVRMFLSFAFAEWTPPLNTVGSNSVAERSWEQFVCYDLRHPKYLRGWVDEHSGKLLTEAFPCFLACWRCEEWQEPIALAVNWLIESTRGSGGIDGAIAFGQIPLEMLAWRIFVEERGIINSNEFESLSASSKLQMLLAHCGIPFDVPASLPNLSKIALEQKKASGKESTGPQLATKIRNTIIHPNAKNREILANWETTYSIREQDVRAETQELFQWYITLVLLRVIKYQGKYVNRLTQRSVGEIEMVPWATSTSS